MKVSIRINPPALLENIESIRESMELSELLFVSDSQDVNDIKEHLGNKENLNPFVSFFVDVAEGDYKTIYGCKTICPRRKGQYVQNIAVTFK